MSQLIYDTPEEMLIWCSEFSFYFLCKFFTGLGLDDVWEVVINRTLGCRRVNVFVIYFMFVSYLE